MSLLFTLFGILVVMPATATDTQSVTKVITPIKSYITPPGKVINEVAYQGAQLTIKALDGTPMTIPRTWRLVTALPIHQQLGKDSKYILFFQDSNNNVFTLGLSSDGQISGEGAFVLPTQ